MDFNYLIGKLETLRIVIKDLTHDFKVNEDYIDELLAENKELKVMLKDINENEDEDVIIIESRRDNYKLKAEIKSLEKLIDAKHKKRNEDSNLIAELKLAIVDQNDDIKTLKAEIKELKQCSNVAFVEVLNRSNDKLKAENDDLKAENCGLINESKWDKNKLINELKAEIIKLEVHVDKYGAIAYDELQAENKDLRKACKLLKDASHYPKEYKAEAEEYFEHNNHCQEVMFFMLDNTLFNDNDDFDDFINKDDAICVINNEEIRS